MWPVTTKQGSCLLPRKMWYSFYLKEHFINSKMIPLMCKLDAALQFYGQKEVLISFYFLCFFPYKWSNILKCILPTTALFWCDGAHICCLVFCDRQSPEKNWNNHNGWRGLIDFIDFSSILLILLIFHRFYWFSWFFIGFLFFFRRFYWFFTNFTKKSKKEQKEH